MIAMIHESKQFNIAKGIISYHHCDEEKFLGCL